MFSASGVHCWRLYPGHIEPEGACASGHLGVESAQDRADPFRDREVESVRRAQAQVEVADESAGGFHVGRSREHTLPWCGPGVEIQEGELRCIGDNRSIPETPRDPPMRSAGTESKERLADIVREGDMIGVTVPLAV